MKKCICGTKPELVFDTFYDEGILEGFIYECPDCGVRAECVSPSSEDAAIEWDDLIRSMKECTLSIGGGAHERG